MSEIYIPLKENELPGLREFIQNFDINDCDIEPLEIMSGESNPFYGKKHTPETRKEMVEAWKTRPPFTEETRKKMSEARMGDKNPRYGRKHSAETIKKMSEAKLGNTFAKKKIL
jgi:hypothetical protein